MEIKDDSRAKISNSEVLLIGYIAVVDFNGNYYKAYQYCKELKIVKMLEYSRFIRRLNNLEEVIEKLFLWLGKLFNCKLRKKSKLIINPSIRLYLPKHFIRNMILFSEIF